jgi:HAD superfamily phosphoserine phosphatase-like hydrolase
MVKAFDENLEGVKYSDFKKISSQIALKHKDRVYRYTRDLVKDLKNKNYYLLAISHSPKQIVDSFARKLGFDKIYGAIYECDKNGITTGKKLYKEIISDKSKILERAIEKEGLALKGSIGVGDSEGDIPVLKMVDRPICFNPNKKLYDYARKHKWEIVVERKDVIYHI